MFRLLRQENRFSISTIIFHALSLDMGINLMTRFEEFTNNNNDLTFNEYLTVNLKKKNPAILAGSCCKVIYV